MTIFIYFSYIRTSVNSMINIALANILSKIFFIFFILSGMIYFISSIFLIVLVLVNDNVFFFSKFKKNKIIEEHFTIPDHFRKYYFSFSSTRIILVCYLQFLCNCLEILVAISEWKLFTPFLFSIFSHITAPFFSCAEEKTWARETRVSPYDEAGTLLPAENFKRKYLSGGKN